MTKAFDVACRLTAPTFPHSCSHVISVLCCCCGRHRIATLVGTLTVTDPLLEPRATLHLCMDDCGRRWDVCESIGGVIITPARSGTAGAISRRSPRSEVYGTSQI